MIQTALTLDSIKEKVIHQIVEELIANGAISESDRSLKQLELEQLTQNKQMVTQYREQSGVTNSFNYNQTAYELYVDITTTFKFLNELEKFIDKHEDLSQSSIHTLTLLITKANDELQAIEKMVHSKTRPNSHVESFSDTASLSTDPTHYTDRYGEEIEASNHATIRVEEGVLSLPYNRKISTFTYDDGKVAGEVTLTKQVGGAFSYGTLYSKNLEAITDLSLKTYWGDSLFTDEPIRISFSSVKPTNPAKLRDFYYGIQHGALFELEFNFESITRINEVDLSPYCRFPIDLVAIRYQTTDDFNEPLKEVLYPGHLDENLSSRPIADNTRVHFPEINCKKLYLIFNQQHYTKDIYLINQLDLFKNTLWSQVNQSNQKLVNVGTDVIFKPLYAEKIEKHKELNFINDIRLKDKTTDVKSLLLNKDSYVHSAVKHQYQYGFYNISPNYVEFENTGIHVSSLIESANNISAMTLYAYEKLPTIGGVHYTDVEYYVSCNDGSGYENWQAIYPTNREWIECERLQLDQQYCRLRFPASEVAYVMHNGKVLVEDYDYFLVKVESHEDSDYLCDSINIPSFESNDIYTVKYKPIQKAKELDLVGDYQSIQANTKTESIAARDVSYYQLQEFPLILRDGSDSESVRVKLTNRKTGNVFLDGFDLLCVTDKTNPEHSYKHFNKASSAIQYYTYKNMLYFNQDISSEYDIEVSYLHHISSFRIKAILRNNSTDANWLTPLVEKLSFEMSNVA